MIEVERTELNGLLVIKPKQFKDNRGYFFESFNKEKYSEVIPGIEFVQDNISYSVKNTLRGLHYQAGKFAQGKLCSVLQGEVLDVAVDIRFGSPTFGKYFGVFLSAEKCNQLWIPAGFAHGFSVISNSAVFQYKCSAPYNKNSERTIMYNDPQININWQNNNPVLSPKDKTGMLLSEIEKDFIF